MYKKNLFTILARPLFTRVIILMLLIVLPASLLSGAFSLSVFADEISDGSEGGFPEGFDYEFSEGSGDENGDVLIINGTSAVVTGRITDIVLPDADWGNANCNDGVDVADAVLVARFVAEDTDADISEQGKLNADMNHDGNITGDDVIAILRKIAKLD